VNSPLVLWPTLAGIVFLAIGLVTGLRQASSPSARLFALGPAFVASAVAAFGMEHFVGTRGIMQIIPSWMPAPLFWTYLAGAALLAAAISLALLRYVRLAATLLGVLFLLFVLLIHLPNVAANPGQRITWTVLLRELAFASGAWALAGGRRAVIGRFAIVVPLVFFAVEYFLHPDAAPGLPLPKLTPAWVPLRLFWGYLMGALLLMTGAAALANRRARLAAMWLAIAVTLSVLLLYIPLMALAPTIEAVNYVFDTLLFAGTIWLLARSTRDIPLRSAAPR
jgi:uncharacterized membrane protein